MENNQQKNKSTINRIQRKRTAGWRMPEDSKYVGRPTTWGNPFKDVEDMVYVEAGHRRKNPWVYYCQKTARVNAATIFRDLLMDLNSHDVEPEIYKRFRLMRDTIKDLTGKNLACFCSLSKPCHADALIELANPKPGILALNSTLNKG